MNDELLGLKEFRELKGWLLYDGSCARCRRIARLLDPILTRRHYDLAPLQSAWLSECLDITVALPPTAMEVVTIDGRRFSGGDAVIYLAGKIWWAWPLFAAGQLAPVRSFLNAIYGWLANKGRVCDGNHCPRPKATALLR